jgi:hypothetical protein
LGLAHVVLVRPWRDAHAGGGCCGGDVRGGICLDERVGGEPRHGTDVVGAAYRLLRDRMPTLDVQIVGSDNFAYLVPWSWRAARRHTGVVSALRHAARSTTAGCVLVDGVLVGDLETLGPQGVLDAVRQAGSGTSSTAATV